MRVLRQDVADAPEPSQKRHERRGVEPGDMAAGFDGGALQARTMSVTASREAPRVMRAMKGQMDVEWQMEVDHSRQERKNAQREAHQEAKQIEVRPGHKTPRNAAPRCADWNSRRGPFGSVIQRTRRWMTTALMLTRMQNFSETIRQSRRAKNLRKEQKCPARIFILRDDQEATAELRIGGKLFRAGVEPRVDLGVDRAERGLQLRRVALRIVHQKTGINAEETRQQRARAVRQVRARATLDLREVRLT